MKIEHIAMYAADLEKSKKFFEKYFNAVSGELYKNEQTGFSSYFLTFEGGARLEIMHKSKMKACDNKSEQTGYAHIAFSVGSKARVDEITAILKSDGYEVTSGPRTTGDGYYESCVLGEEGNRIEITV